MPGDAGKPTLTAPTPHVSRTSWPNAVKHDRLVDMGFEDNEADQFIEKVPKLAFPGSADGTLFRASPPPTVIELSEDITSDFIPLPEEEAAIAVEKTEEGSRVNLTGNVSEETINRLTAVVHSDQLRENVEAEARRHRAIWQNHVYRRSEAYRSLYRSYVSRSTETLSLRKKKPCSTLAAGVCWTTPPSSPRRSFA